MTEFIISINDSNINEIHKISSINESNTIYIKPNILHKKKEGMLIKLLNEYKNLHNNHNYISIDDIPESDFLIPLNKLKKKSLKWIDVKWGDIMKRRRQIKSREYTKKSRNLFKKTKEQLKKRNSSLEYNISQILKNIDNYYNFKNIK